MSERKMLGVCVICLLLVACGTDEPASSGTGELISFKDVPLDQPGISDALKKVCQESNLYMTAEAKAKTEKEYKASHYPSQNRGRSEKTHR